jgi:hypothetical protein
MIPFQFALFGLGFAIALLPGFKRLANVDVVLQRHLYGGKAFYYFGPSVSGEQDKADSADKKGHAGYNRFGHYHPL